MSSIYSAFCNNTTDLQSVVSDIDKYDRKRVLSPNFTTTDTTNLYQLNNTGFIGQLYKDGVEMTIVTDTPNADNEYNYSSSTDSFQFFLASSSVSALNSAVFEAGQDWDTLKSTVCKEQADLIKNTMEKTIILKINNKVNVKPIKLIKQPIALDSYCCFDLPCLLCSIFPKYLNTN